jgi:heme O synthase-like polyprenyltransferase
MLSRPKIILLASSCAALVLFFSVAAYTDQLERKEWMFITCVSFVGFIPALRAWSTNSMPKEDVFTFGAAIPLGIFVAAGLIYTAIGNLIYAIKN